jgi:hypothetical protein
MKLYRLSAFVLFVFLFTNCQKDKEPTLKEERLNIITTGNWNYTFRGQDTNNDGTFDPADPFENFLADCQTDDTYSFSTSGTYTVMPNTNTNGCTLQNIQGNWELGNNASLINLDGYSGQIDSLTADYFQFHLVMDDNSLSHYILTR